MNLEDIFEGSKTTPNRFDLAELWLKTYFSDKSAVVFFNTREFTKHGLHMHFQGEQYTSLVNAEFGVFEICLEKAIEICNKTPKSCYTRVWDGSSFVHQNV